MEQSDNNQDKLSEPAREEAVAKMQQLKAEDEKARLEDRPSPKVKKEGRKPFWIAFIATAVPIIVLSVLSPVLRVVIPSQSYISGWYMQDILWFVAAGLWGVAFIAAIGFSIARKSQIAAGIWAGFGVGVLALGTTCFANIATYDY